MSEPAEAMPRLPELDRFQMGEWSVRRAEGVLCSGDRSVRLEPRVMDVLVHLAANSGRVVSKEELLEAVWGGAFVEEGALAQAIHGIRKALGDDARQPRFIQTIPKRGYRLVTQIELEQCANAVTEVVSPVPLLSSTSSYSPIPRVTSGRRAGLLLLAFGLAAVVILWLAWKRDDLVRIVVLPFETFDDPEDPYFAGGLTEEITTNLTRLPGVQVIPGRNALGERGIAMSLSEIDKELGADYVLQGNVSWLGKEVRVTPKLIRVEDEAIILATPFIGDADNPFTAQQEISRAVISTLNIALTPEQSQAVGVRSTKNPEAYRAYVQGLVLKDQPFYSPVHLEQAALMFEQAVDMDLGFAEAWAELSQVHSYLAFNTDPSPLRVKRAREALRHALEIDPDLLPVRLAQIYFNYRCLGDFDEALSQADAALQRAPHDAELLKMRGLALMRKGRLDEAMTVFRRASALNPRTRDLVWIIAEIHRALRQYEVADKEYARAISLAPDVPFFWERRALNRLCWTGRSQDARAILNEAPMPATTPQLQLVAIQLDFDERDYHGALARLSSESIRELPLQDQTRLSVLGVIALERLGDHEGAVAAAKVNRAALERRIVNYPKESIYRAYLALTLAQLGQRNEALVQAEEAVRRSRGDAFSGPQVREVQAMVDVTLGRHTTAVAHLRNLLSIPYRVAICTAELRLAPIWEPLLGDPEFETLLLQFERQ